MMQQQLYMPGAGRRTICGFFYVGLGNRCIYLPQVSLSAHCTIIASTSRTTLTQTFTNSSKDDIPELRYTFPVYDGVSVVGFTCTINNDRVIRGVVKERNEARTDYQEALDRGETAGLLENLPQSSDIFTTSVGNVPAGAELKVEIVYLGELKHDAEVDGIRFTIPTAIAPRFGEYPGELMGATTALAKGGIEIVVDAEMPPGCNIKNVQSPSHPISVTIGNTSVGHAAGADMSLQKASATLSLGTAELDKDFIVQVVATNTGDPVAVLETHPTIPNQRALMATLVPKFNLPPMRPEVVFVCDRSGSMGTGKRIPSLISALNVFLKSLPVGVKFNICSFGSHHELLFPDGSETYGAASLAKATKYVSTFAANFGGTSMYAPVDDVIKKRYKDMPLQIFLLTDGEIWDQSNLFSLINERVKESDGEIRVFSIGIGDSVSHSLIDGVARTGNGFSQTVGDNEKMNTKVVRMLKAALTPIVKDYTLEVKYGSDPTQDTDDDFEIVEKVMDGLTIDISEVAPDAQPVAVAPQKPISLFDTNANPDVEMVDESEDTTARGKYAAVPPVPAPKLLQAPFAIPPLYPFNRTNVYLLLSSETTQRTPVSVVLRGTSKHGPLELEIPISAVGPKAETIHQLAARASIRELEDGRGWITHAKDASGVLLKDKYPGRFSDMVEREAVRLGVGFQVACRWCSFVAIEALESGESGQERSVTTTSAQKGLNTRGRELADKRDRLESLKKVRIGASGGPSYNFPVFNSLAATSASWSQPQDALFGRSGGTAPVAPPMRARRMQESVSSFGAAPPPPPPPMQQLQQMGAPGVFGSPQAPSPTVQQAQMSQTSTFGPRRASSSRFREDARREMTFKTGSSHKKRSGPDTRAAVASLDVEDMDDEESEGEALGDVDGGVAGPGARFDIIVARQSFEGFWAWDDALFRSLGIDAAALLSHAGEMLGVGLGDPSNGLATAVVLGLLETELAAQKDEWELLAEKAEGWLDGNVPEGQMSGRDYIEAVKKVLAKLGGA